MQVKDHFALINFFHSHLLPDVSSTHVWNSSKHSPDLPLWPSRESRWSEGRSPVTTHKAEGGRPTVTWSRGRDARCRRHARLWREACLPSLDKAMLGGPLVPRSSNPWRRCSSCLIRYRFRCLRCRNSTLDLWQWGRLGAAACRGERAAGCSERGGRLGFPSAWAWPPRTPAPVSPDFGGERERDKAGWRFGGGRK